MAQPLMCYCRRSLEQTPLPFPQNDRQVLKSDTTQTVFAHADKGFGHMHNRRGTFAKK
jgi:hypothetical protein